MAKNFYEFLHPNEPYDENDTPPISEEIVELIKESSTPDYIHMIEYIEEKEKQNKLRSNIIFVCTILAAIFAGISALPVIMQYFN